MSSIPRPVLNPNGNTGVNPGMPNPVGTGQPASTQPGGIGTTVPTVSVGSSGLLELPYDQSFATGTLEAVKGANDELLGIKTEEDAQGLSYQKALRDSSGAYGQQQRSTRNVNASGGTLFSSKYGTGVVNDATAYANQVGEIESQNSAFTQNANLRKTAIQTALQNQLAALSQAYADKLGGEAGTLGYGQASTKPANHAYNAAIKKAQSAHRTYESAYNRAMQLEKVAKRTNKPADKKAAAQARAQSEKLRKQFRALSQTAKDYKG